MIDIHNHILPNIDDGPTNETEMLDLLKQATTQGVTEIIVPIKSLMILIEKLLPVLMIHAIY